MCGISAALYCSACSAPLVAAAALNALRPSLQRRGPNAHGQITAALGPDAAITFSCAVLHLRGGAITLQPAVSPNGDALAWNGEVWGGLPVGPGESDTEAVLHALCAAGGDAAAICGVLSAIRGPHAFLFWSAATRSLYFGRDALGRRSLCLQTASAPSSIRCAAAALVLSSVPLSGIPAEEVAPAGVYRLRFAAAEEETPRDTANVTTLWRRQTCGGGSLCLELLPWPPRSFIPEVGILPLPRWRSTAEASSLTPRARSLAALELLARLSVAVRSRVEGVAEAAAVVAGAVATTNVTSVSDESLSGASSFPIVEESGAAPLPPFVSVTSRLQSAATTAQSPLHQLPLPSAAIALIKRRKTFLSPSAAPTPDCPDGGAAVAVLFSGGLDSMVLARLAHEHVRPPTATIDLINVCFAGGGGSGASPDRLAAIAGWRELRAACPGRPFQLICVDEDHAAAAASFPLLAPLLHPRDSHMDFNIGAALWHAARGVGWVYVEQSEGEGGQPAELELTCPGGHSSGVAGGGGAASLPDATHRKRVLRYAASNGGPSVSSSSGVFSLSTYDTAAAAGAAAAAVVAAGAGAVGSDNLTSSPSTTVAGSGCSSDPFAGELACVTRGEVACALQPPPTQPVMRRSSSSGTTASGLSRWSMPMPPELAACVAAYEAEFRSVSTSAKGFTPRPLTEVALLCLPTEPASCDGDEGTPSMRTTAQPSVASPSPKQPLVNHRLCGGVGCSANGSKKCPRRLCRSCCNIAPLGASVVVCRLHAPAVGAVTTPAPPSAGHGTATLSSMQSVGVAALSSVSPPPPATTTTRLLRILVRSSARVLLSGIGADEQLAGYGRHRTTFSCASDASPPTTSHHTLSDPTSHTAPPDQTDAGCATAHPDGGWARLAAELQRDCGRLWYRNLGRDDRVISDSGRELRTPFLDEGVVALVRAQVPLPLLVDLCVEHGVGDKRSLRLAARMAGLTDCARLVKRAIHFGSGIARASNVAAYGSNRAANQQRAGGQRWVPPVEEAVSVIDG